MPFMMTILERSSLNESMRPPGATTQSVPPAVPDVGHHHEGARIGLRVHRAAAGAMDDQQALGIGGRLGLGHDRPEKAPQPCPQSTEEGASQMFEFLDVHVWASSTGYQGRGCETRVM